MSAEEFEEIRETFRDSEKEQRRRRREERDRKKNKARRVWRDSWGMKDSDYEEEFVNTHADNLKACSCEMCRTPRKSALSKGKDKLTMQEKRFDIFADQEEDLV